MKKHTGATIVNKVYEHRVLRRLSQRELASAVNVSKQTILAIEKGNYTPSLALGFRLARFFSVDINDLFQFKEEDVVTHLEI